MCFTLERNFQQNYGSIAHQLLEVDVCGSGAYLPDLCDCCVQVQSLVSAALVLTTDYMSHVAAMPLSALLMWCDYTQA